MRRFGVSLPATRILAAVNRRFPLSRIFPCPSRDGKRAAYRRTAEPVDACIVPQQVGRDTGQIRVGKDAVGIESVRPLGGPSRHRRPVVILDGGGHRNLSGAPLALIGPRRVNVVVVVVAVNVAGQVGVGGVGA